MLKVNTKKISVEEFAEKYNMKNLNTNDNPIFGYHVGCFIRLLHENGRIELLDIDGDETCGTLGILFDMIKNDDVIKEEAK